MFDLPHTYLYTREPSAGGKSNGYGGVEMRTGDMPDGVDHGNRRQPPHDGNSGECHRPLVRVHRRRPAPGEDQEVRPKNLCNHLHTHKEKRVLIS